MKRYGLEGFVVEREGLLFGAQGQAGPPRHRVLFSDYGNLALERYFVHRLKRARRTG